MNLIALLWLPMTAIAAAAALTFTLGQTPWLKQTRTAGPDRAPVFAKTAVEADRGVASRPAGDAAVRMAAAPSSHRQVQR